MQDTATLSTTPTPAGEAALDPFHPLGCAKRLVNKPLRNFEGSDQFLRVLQVGLWAVPSLSLSLSPPLCFLLSLLCLLRRTASFAAEVSVLQVGGLGGWSPSLFVLSLVGTEQVGGSDQCGCVVGAGGGWLCQVLRWGVGKGYGNVAALCWLWILFLVIMHVSALAYAVRPVNVED